jgi:hypothetical protein
MNYFSWERVNEKKRNQIKKKQFPFLFYTITQYNIQLIIIF